MLNKKLKLFTILAATAVMAITLAAPKTTGYANNPIHIKTDTWHTDATAISGALGDNWKENVGGEFILPVIQL